MITTPVFRVMYPMLVMMAAGGLTATAQLAPIAKDSKIADVPVSLIGITLPELTFARSRDPDRHGVVRLGEICSRFPATCGDTYGSRCAAANAGQFYAAGTAARLVLPVPLTSVLAARGGRSAVFVTASVLDLVAAFLALAVFEPMRRRMQASGA